MQIEGTTALVTGANRGIGRAFAEGLLARGAAKVYAGARDPSTVSGTDPRLVPVQLDVTDADAVAALAAELGDIRLLVNNAGIARPGAPVTASLQDARDELETNYLGLVSMTQAFAPALAAGDGGAIVNILSVASWASTPQLATYSASKAAAWAYSNASRLELRAQGIHVVGVHVGPVDTDLQAGSTVEKVAPELVASLALDAVESGEPEAIVDDLSRWVKANLPDDHGVIYPMLAQQATGQGR